MAQASLNKFAGEQFEAQKLKQIESVRGTNKAKPQRRPVFS